MNFLTRKIAEWLKVDLQVALLVQNEMMYSNISFSNASTRQLKAAAKDALIILQTR